MSEERDEIRYKTKPSEGALLLRFWLLLAFCLGLEMLLACGLQAWWGEGAKPAAAFASLGVTIFVMVVGGYALDAYQSRNQWETEEWQ